MQSIIKSTTLYCPAFVHNMTTFWQHHPIKDSFSCFHVWIQGQLPKTTFFLLPHGSFSSFSVSLLPTTGLLKQSEHVNNKLRVTNGYHVKEGNRALPWCLLTKMIPDVSFIVFFLSEYDSLPARRLAYESCPCVCP